MSPLYITPAWSRPILCMFSPSERLVPILPIPLEEPAANDWTAPAAVIQAPGRSPRPALQLVQ